MITGAKQRFNKVLSKPLFWLTTFFFSKNAMAQTSVQMDHMGGAAYNINSPGEPTTSELYAFHLSTSNATLVKAGIIPSGSPSHYLNALGYNPVDGNIYGYLMSTGKVFRIGSNGALEDIAVSDPRGLLPKGVSYVAGDIATDGIYYLYDYKNSNFIKIDLNVPAPTAQLEYTIPTGTFSGNRAMNNINDFIFSPVDNNIYGVTSGLESFMYNPATNIMTVLGTISSTSWYKKLCHYFYGQTGKAVYGG